MATVFTNYEYPQYTKAQIWYNDGGSGHVRAAQDLANKIEAVAGSVILRNTLEHFTHNRRVGNKMTGMWDNAQRSGDVEYQRWCYDHRYITDKLFHIPARLNAENLLLKEGALPERLILTSPMYLKEICIATIIANHKRRKQGEAVKSIDLYVNELAIPTASYYFDVIRSLSNDERKLLRLFAFPPSSKDIKEKGSHEKFWQDLTKISADQVIYDPPIREIFKNSEKLPTPGTAVTVNLKAQCDLEEPFLKANAEQDGNAYKFDIAADDKVGLIMLGGIPTEDAILDYIDQTIKIAKNQSKPEGTNYLFIACGKPELGIYEKALEKLKEHTHSDNIKIIPFTGQDCKEIFGRADITITRSGGLTSMELMRLKDNPLRNDPKKVLIHAQVPKPKLDTHDLAHRALALQLAFKGKQSQNTFYQSDANEQLHDLIRAYENHLILKGIPLWEGGSAAYLLEYLSEDASIVRPDDSFATYFANTFFPESKRSFLNLDLDLVKKELVSAEKVYKKEIFKEKAKKCTLIALGALAIIAGLTVSILAATSTIFLALFIIIPLTSTLCLGGALSVAYGAIYYRKPDMNAQNNLKKRNIACIK